jgi:hypothetical protein
MLSVRDCCAVETAAPRSSYSRRRRRKEIEVEYMLLIYNDEQAWSRLSDEERRPIIREYYALTTELRDHGRYVSGAPLQPTAAASTVRVRDDEQLVTDGPFAETKEQLGGYFLIEADSDEEARAWAAKIPAARYGSIEVRPVLPVPAEAPAA